MSITLDAFTLPEDLRWLDEYGWTPVAQSLGYTLSGSLIIDEATRLKGRPITLGGAWMARADVEALRATLTAPSDMTLSLHDGRTFAVRWRHGDDPITATQWVETANPDAADSYFVTLRLMEV